MFSKQGKLTAAFKDSHKSNNKSLGHISDELSACRNV